jgi:hypothetical protein
MLWLRSYLNAVFTIMAGLWQLIDEEPVLMLRSAQAGRMLLENTFLAAGMSPADAADAADNAINDLADSGPGLSTVDEVYDARAILDRIEGRLAQVLESGEDGAVVAERLKLLGDLVPLGELNEAAKIKRVLLALLIFVNIAPHFTISSDRGWEISNQPMIVDLVGRVLQSVDRGIDAWKEAHHDLASQNHHPPDQKPPGSQGGSRSPARAADPGGPGETSGEPQGSHPKSSGPGEGSASAPPGSSLVTVSPSSNLTESERIVHALTIDLDAIGLLLENERVDLGKGNAGLPDRDLALMFVEKVRAGLNQVARSAPLAKLDTRSYLREHHKTWRREAPFTFDVGLIPIRRHDYKATVYRLAVRVQAPGMFKAKAWREIYQGIGHVLRGVASVRATREVQALATAPNVGIQHGHGISIENGPRGSISCVAIEKRANTHLLITAGHVVASNQKLDLSKVTEVYTPPYSEPAHKPIGRVVFASLFQTPWQDSIPSLTGGATESDIAAVAVNDATLIAQPQFRHREGILVLQKATREIVDQDVIDRTSVVKGKAMTRATPGEISAVDMAVNITYPDTLRTVCARGLVEVRLDEPVRPGDSGAACFDQAGRLIGIVVAGSDRASQDAEFKKWSPQVYIQPVHELFLQHGWEIF